MSYEKKERVYTREGHKEELRGVLGLLNERRDSLSRQLEQCTAAELLPLWRAYQLVSSRIETATIVTGNLRSGQPSHGYSIGEAWTSEEASGGYHVTNRH